MKTSLTPSDMVAVMQDALDKFKAELKSDFKRLENTLIIKLSSVCVVCVGIAFFAFAYIFDYRLDFTNDQNQARYTELKGAVFTSSNDAIIREIREIKSQLYSLEMRDERKKIKPKKKVK